MNLIQYILLLHCILMALSSVLWLLGCSVITNAYLIFWLLYLFWI